MEARQNATLLADALSRSTPPVTDVPKNNINIFMAQAPLLNATKLQPSPSQTKLALPVVVEAAAIANGSVLINRWEKEETKKLLLSKLSGIYNTTTTTSTFSRTTGVTTTTTATESTRTPAATRATPTRAADASSAIATPGFISLEMERSWLDVLSSTIAVMRGWDLQPPSFVDSKEPRGVPSEDEAFDALAKEGLGLAEDSWTLSMSKIMLRPVLDFFIMESADSGAIPLRSALTSEADRRLYKVAALVEMRGYVGAIELQEGEDRMAVLLERLGEYFLPNGEVPSEEDVAKALQPVVEKIHLRYYAYKRTLAGGVAGLLRAVTSRAGLSGSDIGSVDASGELVAANLAESCVRLGARIDKMEKSALSATSSPDGFGLEENLALGRAERVAIRSELLILMEAVREFGLIYLPEKAKGNAVFQDNMRVRFDI